jgi:hypothetical protein
MNTLIIFFAIWVMFGFMLGLSIISIISIFIVNSGSESNKIFDILYILTVIFGGPLMWIFAYWVRKEAVNFKY